MSRHRQGFTLIELVITIAIAGILMMMALPVFHRYVENVRVRTAAESFLAGVQTARAEAIRLNSHVEFMLTNSAPVPDDGSDTNYPLFEDAIQPGRYAANKITSNDNGYNWLVRSVPATLSCVDNAASDQLKACWFLAGKTGAEGGGRNDAGSSTRVELDSSAATSIIRFTPFGGTNLAAAAVYKFNNPSAGTCVESGGTVRCLNVFVTPGGRARLCDPSVTEASDTRKC